MIRPLLNPLTAALYLKRIEGQARQSRAIRPKNRQLPDACDNVQSAVLPRESGRLSGGSTSAGVPAKLIVKQVASSPDIIDLIGRHVFRQRKTP